MTYTLVFSGNANIDDGKISILSPVGTVRLGHRAGEEIERRVPAGPVRLRAKKC